METMQESKSPKWLIVSIIAFISLALIVITAVVIFFFFIKKQDTNLTSTDNAAITPTTIQALMEKKCTPSYDATLQKTYQFCANYWKDATNAALGSEDVILFTTPDATESLMFYRQAYDAQMQDLQAYLKSGAGLSEITNLKSVTISGQKGFQFEFIPQDGYKGMGYAYTTTDHMWGIAYLAESEVYDTNKAAYLDAMQTFSVGIAK
jgi:hypothetical protein